jgi:hypothetical protein
MTTVYRHPDGELTVPISVHTEGFIGCGMARIGPGDPDFEEWQQAIERGLTDVVSDPADQGSAGYGH